MALVDDFKKSIYKENLFDEHKQSVVLVEKQNKEENKKQDKLKTSNFRLEEVTLNYNGSIIQIANRFLEETSKIYKSSKSERELSFSNVCDGILFVEKEGKIYLIIIEMKSGFGEIVKAVKQIVASYVKIKQFLLSLKSYNPDDYEERALIFSYPFDTKTPVPADIQPSQRKSDVMENGLSSFADRIKYNIRKNHKVVLNFNDIQGTDLINIDESLCPVKLSIRHIELEKGTKIASENLNDILC